MVLGGVYYGQTYMNRLGLGENGKGRAASEYGQGRCADVVVEGPRRGGDRETVVNELVGELFGTQGAFGHQKSSAPLIQETS